MSCTSESKETQRMELFPEYFTALSKGDGSHWKYLTDTVKLWFDDKKGELHLKRQ